MRLRLQEVEIENCDEEQQRAHRGGCAASYSTIIHRCRYGGLRSLLPALRTTNHTPQVHVPSGSLFLSLDVNLSGILRFTHGRWAIISSLLSFSACYVWAGKTKVSGSRV
jgi:hypothetical protein